MRTGTSPGAITPPRAAMARAVRTGGDLPAAYSAHLAEHRTASPDRAAAPGSNDSPARGTTQPERKGVQRGARGSR